MSNQRQWDASPLASFTTFVTGPDFASMSTPGWTFGESTSAKTDRGYINMFRQFTGWLTYIGKPFSQVHPADLPRFFDQYLPAGTNNVDLAYRYRCLLARCYDYLGVKPNPASTHALENLRTRWDVDPMAGFAELVALPEFATRANARAVGSKSLSPESTKTYLGYFKRIVNWFLAKGKRFSEVTDNDLVDFVYENRLNHSVNAKSAYLYLRLLQRCYAYLGFTENANPAFMAQKVAGSEGLLDTDADTRALNSTEIAAFVRCLPETKPLVRSLAGDTFVGWASNRNHALLAVLLYAGLRASEVSELELSEIDDPFAGRDENSAIALVITPRGRRSDGPAHETILRGYGAIALRVWLDERRELGVRGNLVFPTATGNPLTLTAVSAMVLETFCRAKLDARHSGANSLRATFAVEELRYGTSPEQVRAYLGLAGKRSLKRFEVATCRRKK